MAICHNPIQILLVSAGMLVTADVPLILQVQREKWPRFIKLQWAGA